MEYHEHSYLVSLLFAAPFLLFINFSNFFLLVDHLKPHTNAYKYLISIHIISKTTQRT